MSYSIPSRAGEGGCPRHVQGLSWRKFLLLFYAERDTMTWWEGASETRVLIAQGPTGGNHVGDLLSLRHPKTGNTTCYLLCSDGILQELHWFKQSYGSWFLGDYVCEDGRFYTATPVDPVFILLPIFEDARMKKGDDQGKFRQLDEIMYVQGYPGYQSLSSIAEKSMQVVCDVQEVDSSKFFRLNDMKILKWLCFKVRQLKQALPTLDKNYAAQNEKDTLFEAVSIVGEYVKDEPWMNHLRNKLEVQDYLNKDIKMLSPPIESAPDSFNPAQERNDKKTSRATRQAKKAKVEKDSQKIKDMFTRATRKKG